MDLYEIILDGDNKRQRIIAEGIGFLKGPNLPNWQESFFFLRIINPFNFRNEEVKFILVSPRYKGVDINKIQEQACTVGVSRVLPEREIKMGINLNPKDIDYFSVGEIRPVKQ